MKVVTDVFGLLAALYNLEKDWRDIVEQPSSLSEREQHQQTAVWELVHTEVAYIHTLKVVTDVRSINEYFIKTVTKC